GRRYINSKHRHSFARLFKLEEIEEAYFKLLILIDSATTAKERTELTERSHVVRKALSAETRVVSLEDETDLYSTLEIFAAFGLFENKLTLMQLVKLYEKRNDVSVPKALNRLEEMNMIYTTGEGQFGIRHDQVFFNSSSKGSHISYLQTAIMEAHSKVPELFLEKDDAYFDAKVISVQRDEYKRILREIRLAINETQSKMESGNADTLVRFSVQVFPISFEL
ncbi:MAG: hypothetical protein NTV34_10500, partial [Proteobacteria bacterium]|nr:hypothetical protein [Pseudomonadota bacterium]